MRSCMCKNVSEQFSLLILFRLNRSYHNYHWMFIGHPTLISNSPVDVRDFDRFDVVGGVVGCDDDDEFLHEKKIIVFLYECTVEGICYPCSWIKRVRRTCKFLQTQVNPFPLPPTQILCLFFKGNVRSQDGFSFWTPDRTTLQASQFSTIYRTTDNERPRRK